MFKIYQPESHEAVSVAAVEKDVSPLALGLSLVGAAMLLIGVFLPRVSSTTFARIGGNTLIQSGDGWIFVGLAVGIAVSSWYAYQRRAGGAGVLILGAIAVGFAIFYGTNRSSLTLCAVGPAAPLLNIGCHKGSPGVGIFAVGIGGLLAVAGGWRIWQAEDVEAAPSAATPTSTTDPSRQPPSAIEPTPTDDVATRLTRLDELRQSGLITEDEYRQRRAAILELL
jgi:hypothetical protein